MITPDNARTLTYGIISGLTFIESLIITAANSGYYSITMNINDQRINPLVVQSLITTGFTVQTITDSTYDRYIIDWLPTPSPSRTPPNTPSLSISSTPSLSISATRTPSRTPSLSISATPSLSISRTPSITPSLSISTTPSLSISATPSLTPTTTPSLSISATPTPSLSISATITPSLSISSTPSLSISKTPSLTPTRTPSITPSTSILPNVTIWNNSGTYSITGVTVDSVEVSGVSFPVDPGQTKSGFTAKGLTGITITVGLSSVSTGECINIDGEDHTTDGNYEYSNTNGSTNNVSIIYNFGPC